MTRIMQQVVIFVQIREKSIMGHSINAPLETDAETTYNGLAEIVLPRPAIVYRCIRRQRWARRFHETIR